MNLNEAHKFSSENKKLLNRSDQAGCFYCLKIYDPKEIKEWLPLIKTSTRRVETALCPKCGIDSVLPSCKVGLTPKFLEEMYEYWFNQTITVMKEGKLVEEKLLDASNY